MPDQITARFSEEISEPELSQMWETERMTFNPGTGDGIDTWLSAPELVISAHGKEAVLSFPSGGPDAGHARLKAAFVRAVGRIRPNVKVEWAA